MTEGKGRSPLNDSAPAPPGACLKIPSYSNSPSVIVMVFKRDLAGVANG